MNYEYRREILEELMKLGVRPSRTTPPELLRDYLNDLYRLKLRHMRDQLLRREIPKQGYSARVVELRKRFLLLSVPIKYWTS